MLKKILDHIDHQEKNVVDLQTSLVAIPALGPKNGGDGELEKAEFVKEYLRDLGITDIKNYDSPDPSVSTGSRPNVAAIIPGKDTSRTLWIIAHLDIVPPGSLDLWKTDPYTLVRDGDLIYGRGVEDNHQGMVSGIVTARALLETGTTPEINLGLMMVADEETSSEHGLEYVVNNHEELFGPDDLIVVPDFGEPNGEMVEIAEKSMCWIKVTVNGKQCHASTPDQGVNTLVAAAALILKVGKLHEIFNDRDELFEPSKSTFQPTMKEANVTNVNTIPGQDVFYIDCRVLPQYDIDEVMNRVREMSNEVESEYGVTINLGTEQREQASDPTPLDSPVVVKVMDAVKKIYNNNPRPMGVGGGTVAAFLRRKGHDAVVWSTLMHNAHQPNEHSSIAFTLGDAKVFATMLF